MASAVRHDRFRRLEREHYDVIVVGAGMGGLTAAALLAKRGRAVLVVDRHYVPGGCATIFKRPGYEFDVGLHYVGDCGPAGALPRILNAAGASVRFNAMDRDGFDTLVFPDFEFRVPAGIENYRQRLVEHFPKERAGIDRYIRFLNELETLNGVVAKPRKAFSVLPRSLLALRYLTSTVGSFLDTCTHDPKLRAVLVGESGDYGAPPSKAALTVHAALMLHYLKDGGFYPEGGGQTLADALAASIEASGGKLLLSTMANRILIESGRAVGVEIENKHLGRQTVRAPIVIANSDLKKTMLELVGAEHLSKRTVRKVRGYEMAPGIGTVYLGIERDLVKEGMRNTNFWIFPDYDCEAIYAATRAGQFYRDPVVYVSSASLKDPKNPKLAPAGITNIQLMCLAPSTPAAWGISDEEFLSGAYRKSAAYADKKQEFARQALRVAEQVFPQLSEQLAFQEVSTPLTHSRYTLASNGTSYGLAHTPEQFLHRRPGTKTEIPGLLLAGANTRMGHGIMGATIGGVAAAAAVAGGQVFKEALGGVSVGIADKGDHPPPGVPSRRSERAQPSAL